MTDWEIDLVSALNLLQVPKYLKVVYSNVKRMLIPTLQGCYEGYTSKAPTVVSARIYICKFIICNNFQIAINIISDNIINNNSFMY
jgi:hypothetical protein